MDIDADGLFDETSFLVKPRSFWPLLHLLANSSDINHQVLVSELLSNFHTTRHPAHLDGSTSDTSVALCIVLLHVDALVTHFGRRVYVGTFVKFLGLCCVALVFNL